MPKISIIIAVYNVTNDYLIKCLESIVNQTLREIEIIIIDDGSTTDCVKICDEYAERDNRIKLIHKKNEGVSVASNLGITMATGEYITFVDHDDWIDLNMCERAYENVKESGADAAIWLYQSALLNGIKKCYYVGPEKKIFEKYEIKLLQAQILDVFAYKDLRISLIGANWCKLYKTKYIKESVNARFPEGLMGGEDALFTFRALENMEKIVLFEDYLYYYRQNSQSYTKRFNPNMLDDELKMIRNFSTLVKNDEVFQIPYIKNICNSYICLCLNFLFHRDNQMSMRAKSRYIKNLLAYKEYSSAIKKYKKCGFSSVKRLFFFFSEHRCTNLVLLMAKTYSILSKEKKYN